MAKRMLVEVNAFTRLLSLFYKSKEQGNEKELFQSLQVTDPIMADVYKRWDEEGEKVLQVTRSVLVKNGYDTTDIDNLLKKYH